MFHDLSKLRAAGAAGLAPVLGFRLGLVLLLGLKQQRFCPQFTLALLDLLESWVSGDWVVRMRCGPASSSRPCVHTALQDQCTELKVAPPAGETPSPALSKKEARLQAVKRNLILMQNGMSQLPPQDTSTGATRVSGTALGGVHVGV